jgi:signal transduction histidine kinase
VSTWSRWRSSLRAKILGIVTIGIVVPVTLIGAWTSRRLEHAGKELLRSELDSTLAEMERLIARDWPVRRGELMLLAENNVVPTLVSDTGTRPGLDDEEFIKTAFAQLGGAVTEIIWTNAAGRPTWRLLQNPGGTLELSPATAAGEVPRSRIGQLVVHVPITDGATEHTYGAMAAVLRASSLVPADPMPGLPPAARFRVIDVATETPVVDLGESIPTNTDTNILEEMVAVTRRIASPPLRLEAMAPSAPYVAPFGRSARNGTILTLLVAMIALGGASVITARVTRSLGALGESADAVARGEFDRQIEVYSDDEIGRVSKAFNTMTRDLRRSIQESAQRRSLAAVGEFAAELAHEVRNPLTAVRLDLQRLDERLPTEGDLHDRMRRILSVIDRLNRTVTGSLRVARSGSVTLRPVALDAALDPAIDAATPELQAHGVALVREGVDARSVWLKGDGDALTQLFLNLLLNAAQAIDETGSVTVAIDRQADVASVMITDTGRGMTEDMMGRLQQPLHSTKPSGTGLGVTIARRIASAHGGAIGFSSRVGFGTSVTVTLPCVSTHT